MALPESYAAYLDSIKSSSDVPRLREIYKALKVNLERQSSQRAGLASLVLCAECAIKVARGAFVRAITISSKEVCLQVGCTDVAAQCLDEYYLEARR
jgi:hypothetical protein